MDYGREVSNGLRWSASGGDAARQGRGYTGSVLVAPSPSSSSPATGEKRRRSAYGVRHHNRTEALGEVTAGGNTEGGGGLSGVLLMLWFLPATAVPPVLPLWVVARDSNPRAPDYGGSRPTAAKLGAATVGFDVKLTDINRTCKVTKVLVA
ncbi:hypothetical protein Tsubulata_000820 [Turnera subulata]|uniref:Uncharacterized protein n=1 Tax=Turnera subulata TaxID=218843 RepID=A0A9Q0GBS1_9ROSI|nr:hypothetical protein Tsubulata_000820 [Turnera subulata]